MWEAPRHAEFDGGERTSDDDEELVQDEELLTGDAEERGVRSESVRRESPSAIVRRQGFLRYGRVVAGKYFVDHVLGRSGRDIVVHARHLELGQRVVLRSLRPEACSSTEAVARFVRGARAVLKLQSERVERIIDLGRLESGAPYRVTELPRGPSLAEVIRVRGPLPVAEAVDYVVLASEGVAEAHALGIIHRNLSTTSLVLERRPDGPPSVRLLDVGVSDPLEPVGIEDPLGVFDAAAIPTSLPYAAPEQIRAPESVDARADVWALGAVLYELLTGTPVYQSDTAPSLLAMITADAPVPVSLFRGDVHPELEAVILRCLEKDRDARFRSMAELALAVVPFASDAVAGAAGRIERVASRSMRQVTSPPPSYDSHSTAGRRYTSSLRVPGVGLSALSPPLGGTSHEMRAVPTMPTIPVAPAPTPGIPISAPPVPQMASVSLTPPPSSVRTPTSPPPLPRSSKPPTSSMPSPRTSISSFSAYEQPQAPVIGPKMLLAAAAVLGVSVALGVYSVTHARSVPSATALLTPVQVPQLPAPAVLTTAEPMAKNDASPSALAVAPTPAAAPPVAPASPTPAAAPARAARASAPSSARDRDDFDQAPEKTAASPRREAPEKKPPADDLFGGMR